jgi:hypothetical protein
MADSEDQHGLHGLGPRGLHLRLRRVTCARNNLGLT